jgi:non-ribosomal peptide synthetase component F
VELTVHRLVEQRVAECGENVALVQEAREISYRELNQRANALARRLMASGFRRQSHAVVAMECSIDLAVTLLAVLKAGGTYTWMPPRGGASEAPASAYPEFSFAVARAEGGDDRYLALNIRPLLAEEDAPAPNLPVLTRANETACLLPNEQGRPILVPHDSIVALQQRDVSGVEWRGEPGALDLWVGLMRGTTLSVMPAADSASLENAA